MQTRTLGHAGPALSVVGLGTWAIGGPWQWGWGPQDDHESITAIRASLENGVSWIDTAPVYGLGHAEEIVSQAMAGMRRDDIFLATKCGLVWNRKRQVRISLSAESIRAEVEASLRRLGTEYIDLYQHHWPDPDTPIEASWEAMIKLQEAGKVRYIGVCNYNAAQLEACGKLGQVQSLQPPLSMLQREILAETLSYCAEHEIGVIAYSPLQTGLLTGTFNKEKLAEDDWRRHDKYFKEPLLSKALALVERLRPMAEAHGGEVSHLAIAWVLAQQGVTAAIVGARNETQAKTNARASEFALQPEQLSQIDNWLHELGI